MVRRKDELVHQFREQMKGGEGTVEVVSVLQPEDYAGSINLIAKLILNPGCSLGYHVHEGEEELIHVLAGTAAYRDGDEDITLYEGDSAACPSGHGHSIACPKDAAEPLMVYAVIHKV